MLPARDELNAVISLGVGRVITKKFPGASIGDFETLKANNAARLLPIPNLSHQAGDEASERIVKKMRNRTGSGSSMWNKFIVPLGARAALNSIIELKAVDLGYTNDYPCGESSAVAGSTWAQAGANKKKKYYPCLYVSDSPNDLELPVSGDANIRYKLRSKTVRQDEEGNKRYSAEIEIHSIDAAKAIEDAKPPKQGQRARVKQFAAREELSAILRPGESESTQNGLRGELEEIVQFSEGDAVGKATGDALKKIAKLYRARGAGAVVERQRQSSEYFPRLLRRPKTMPNKGWSPERSDMARGLSARDTLNQIVELADPRPRNPLGMFTDNEENGPDPDKIDVVYKREIPKTVGQNLAGGAVAGVGAAASGSAVKALFNKLKKTKAKL